MRILLIDDHRLFREGLRYILEGYGGDPIELLEAGSCEEGLKLNEDNLIDLVLLDLGLPDGCDRFSCLRRLHAYDPTLPVVVVSAQESREIIDASLANGASGYIPKSSSSALVFHAIKLVLAGEIYLPAIYADAPTHPQHSPRAMLTNRQNQVLHLLAQGHSNKSIANILGISPGTARVHVTAIIRLLGVSNRTEAASKALRLGYIPESDLV